LKTQFLVRSVGSKRLAKDSAIALIFFGVADVFYLHVLCEFRNISVRAGYGIEGDQDTAGAVARNKINPPVLPCRRADFSLSFARVEREPCLLLLTLTLLVWSGHSCPLPLTLLLALTIDVESLNHELLHHRGRAALFSAA